jgi:hypothetical protein
MKKQFYISNCIRSFATSFKLRFPSGIVFMLLILAWGGVHATAQTVAPICPAGYAYTPGTKQCETTKPKVCPEGTVFNSGSCVKRINSTCPIYYDKILPSSAYGNMGCIKHANVYGIPIHVNRVCPNGYWKLAEVYCLSSATYPKVCPAGFTLRTTDNVCVSQKTPSCPQGYRFNALGRCTSNQTAIHQ